MYIYRSGEKSFLLKLKLNQKFSRDNNNIGTSCLEDKQVLKGILNRKKKKKYLFTSCSIFNVFLVIKFTTRNLNVRNGS